MLYMSVCGIEYGVKCTSWPIISVTKLHILSHRTGPILMFRYLSKYIYICICYAVNDH